MSLIPLPFSLCIIFLIRSVSVCLQLWIAQWFKKKKKRHRCICRLFLLSGGDEVTCFGIIQTWFEVSFCSNGNILYIQHTPMYGWIIWYSSVYFCIKEAGDHCWVSNEYVKITMTHCRQDFGDLYQKMKNETFYFYFWCSLEPQQ